ncbi:MAG TPA: hypothetical protein VF647_13885 [Longimicrobium sp.]|jgi:hypothetical protein
MSTSYQAVRLAVVDGASPRECNPWNAEHPLAGYEKLINELCPTIATNFQQFDEQRFRVAWDSPSDLQARKGEAWQRFVGVLVDAVGAEGISSQTAVENTVIEICNRIATESNTPMYIRVGFYIFVMTSERETQFQADLSQGLRDKLNEKFKHLPPDFRIVKTVSDPKFLIKALEAETSQLARNLGTWKIRQPALSLTTK